MGMEQEWKLQTRNPATLTRIFQDARILDLQATPSKKSKCRQLTSIRQTICFPVNDGHCGAGEKMSRQSSP